MFFVYLPTDIKLCDQGFGDDLYIWPSNPWSQTLRPIGYQLGPNNKADYGFKCKKIFG